MFKYLKSVKLIWIIFGSVLGILLLSFIGSKLNDNYMVGRIEDNVSMPYQSNDEYRMSDCDGFSYRKSISEAMTSGSNHEDQGIIPGNVSYADIKSTKIIKRMSITLEIRNYTDTYKQITDICDKLKGFISNSTLSTDSKGRKSGYIVLRIPINMFAESSSNIEALGRLENKQITGEDVTEQYFDTESRITNLKSVHKRMLDLASKSGNVADLLSVERELQRITQEMEVFKGKMKYLDNAINYSTITVNVHEPEAIFNSNTNDTWILLKKYIFDGIKACLFSFINVTRSLFMLISALIPVAIFAVVIGYLINIIIKKFRKYKAQ